MKGSSWESCGVGVVRIGGVDSLRRLNEGQLLGELRDVHGRGGTADVGASMKGSSWESWGSPLPRPERRRREGLNEGQLLGELRGVPVARHHAGPRPQ